MTHPKVSVIIPVYNAEKYLDRCVGSVLSQTYENLEVILVDDGSFDSSPSMCDIWAEKDHRVKAVHKLNEGAGLARNSGIDVATGDYITFVDSDDYIAAETVSRCVDSFLSFNCDAVAFGRSVVTPNGDIKEVPVTTPGEFYEGKEVADKLLCSMLNYSAGFGVSVWGKMYSTNVIKAHGIVFSSERLCFSEDTLFNLDFFANAQSAFVLGDNLYFHSETESSLSRAVTKDREQLIHQFLNSALAAAENYGLSAEVRVNLQVRYQHYLMAVFKGLITADVCKTRKIPELRALYNNVTLRSTLNKRTLKYQKASLRMFYGALRLRLFPVADLLLWIKVKL